MSMCSVPIAESSVTFHAKALGYDEVDEAEELAKNEFKDSSQACSTRGYSELVGIARIECEA